MGVGGGVYTLVSSTLIVIAWVSYSQSRFPFKPIKSDFVSSKSFPNRRGSPSSSLSSFLRASQSTSPPYEEACPLSFPHDKPVNVSLRNTTFTYANERANRLTLPLLRVSPLVFPFFLTRPFLPLLSPPLFLTSSSRRTSCPPSSQSPYGFYQRHHRHRHRQTTPTSATAAKASRRRRR